MKEEEWRAAGDPKSGPTSSFQLSNRNRPKIQGSPHAPFPPSLLKRTNCPLIPHPLPFLTDPRFKPLLKHLSSIRCPGVTAYRTPGYFSASEHHLQPAAEATTRAGQPANANWTTQMTADDLTAVLLLGTDVFSPLSVEMELRQLWAEEPGNLGSRPGSFSHQLWPWATHCGSQ